MKRSIFLLRLFCAAIAVQAILCSGAFAQQGRQGPAPDQNGSAREDIAAFKSSNPLKDRWFVEIWNDTGWRKTNFGTDVPGYRERNWYISQTVVKVGYRFPLRNKWFLDPYLRLNVFYDFGNKVWNKYHWTNHEEWGPGVRLRHEWKNEADAEEMDSFLKLDSFDWDALFIEYMMNEDSFDSTKDRIPDNVPEDNFRIGTAFYSTASSRMLYKDKLSLFADCWGEWAYSTTNFYEEGIEDFYILQLQPKAGLKWLFQDFSIQPYYGADLTYDFGSEEWNKKEWLNNIQYGPGIRFSFNNIWGHKGTNIRIYAEMLRIYWFSRVDPAEYENKAKTDTRVGIEFWLPFGSTKESITRA